MCRLVHKYVLEFKPKNDCWAGDMPLKVGQKLLRMRTRRRYVKCDVWYKCKASYLPPNTKVILRRLCP